MKAKLFFLFLLLLPALSFAQFNASIDITGSLGYGYRNLSPSDDVPMAGDFIRARNANETGKLVWGFGVNYNHRLSSRFFLKTGLRYGKMGYKTEKITGLRWGSEHDGMGNWIPDPTLPHEMETFFEFTFIEIPLALRWELGDQKIKPFVEMGVAGSILLSTEFKQITDIGTETSEISPDSTFNKAQMAGLVSVGVSYAIQPLTVLFLQPVFRYHLTGVRDFGVKEQLYSFNLEIGLRRGFGGR